MTTMQTATQLGQDALDKLEALAQSLGSTVEALYPTLVAETGQLGLRGILLGIGLLAIAVIAALATRTLFCAHRHATESNDRADGTILISFMAAVASARPRNCR